MTALADISKAHPSLHGDSLRGTDLAQFNAQHKRDEQGRFAAIAAAPAQADPRAARQARRLRRVRRQVKGAQVQAQAAAAQEKAQEAKSDPRSLQALHRLRVLPQKVQQRAQAKPQAKPAGKQEKDAKAAINDKEYLAGQEVAHRLDEPGYVLMDSEHAEEFVDAGTMIPGAANAHWNTSLQVFTADGLMQHSKDNDLTGKVAIAVGGHVLVTEEAMQPNALTLAEGQYIAVNEMDEKKGVKWHRGPLELTHKGKTIEVPRVEAGAYDPEIGRIMLSEQKYPNIQKSDETWDEDEHKRDPRSGRFTALAATAVLAPSVEEDPRIARAARRRRRSARAATAATAAPQVEAKPSARDRILQQKLRERETARRAEPRYRTHPKGKPGTAGKPQEEPPPPPKRPPNRYLPSGGVNEGGRIVSQAQWEAIQRADKETRISNRTPSRQLPVRSKVTAEPEIVPVKLRMVETEALGEAPRIIYDEFDQPINLAEIRRYVNAKRAAGSRKAPGSPS